MHAVEAADEGGLAAAGGPDDGGDLAARNVQRDVSQCLWAPYQALSFSTAISLMAVSLLMSVFNCSALTVIQIPLICDNAGQSAGGR